MTEPTLHAIDEFDWVLVIAPYRQDAAHVEALLGGHGLRVRRCVDDADLGDLLEKIPGVVIATHEALSPAAIQTIAYHSENQPAWSEMSIVVLLDRKSQQATIRRQLASAWARARIIFYQRPISALELVSGVQAAMLARLRQRDVRDHIERETILRLELNHRVKNVLASVSSMFQMSRRGATSLEAFADEFSDRLNALSRVHAAVFEAGGESVSLIEIVDLTVSPYQQEGHRRIQVRGPDLLVGREAGTTLALCLHELATNALKYGALSEPRGTVALEWTVTTGSKPSLALEWREKDGPTVVEPSRQGYGTRYIRSALGSLFGRPPSFVYSSSGLVCGVSGPLEGLQAGR
ncbi:two-component sensor histidine kinase [Devosia subaequoris]|uniref:histidine kinase n=1 Tax=Devosia subaequoris TaxID=395930 RepID=A0A7W6IIS0_9HYPH|nr:sensor histidine kinase [Devosia subaequoris]MBB4050403.1 two-component sensor histidine kinase [Devosia subaequoris]MCP1208904.1 sensor histidine kinase [Devosia subaequoris]